MSVTTAQPGQKTNAIHYQNGQWVAEEDCKISVLDLTVLRGFGVFDFLCTYNKKPFLLQDHVDRFYNSAAELGLKIPKSKEELKQILRDGIERSVHDELYVKIILTGGIAADGITPGESSLICLFLKAGSYPLDNALKGVALKSITYERPLPVAKSLNYMTAVVELSKAKKEGFADVLYISHEGKILEGTTVNFFAVKDGILYTADTGVLYGCTRKFIFRLLKELELKVVTASLDKSELSTFTEAFICSTTRPIHPVVRVDETPIGDGQPGPITKRVMQAFEDNKQLLDLYE